MKGWRPSACQGSKTGSGPFQAAHSPPDSLNNRPVFPGPRGDGDEDDKVRLSRAIRLAALKSQTTPKSVREFEKRRQPFTCSDRTEDYETKTGGMTDNPKSTRPKTAQLAKSSAENWRFFPCPHPEPPFAKGKGPRRMFAKPGRTGRRGRIGALGSAPSLSPDLIRGSGQASRSRERRLRRGRGAGLAAAFSRSFGHNALISLEFREMD